MSPCSCGHHPWDPPWMAHYYQLSLVSKDKAKFALEVEWEGEAEAEASSPWPPPASSRATRALIVSVLVST